MKKETETLVCMHTGLKPLLPNSELSGYNKCRYVIGDPKKHWAMCGRQVKINTSWCETHSKVVYHDAKAPKTNTFVKRTNK